MGCGPGPGTSARDRSPDAGAGPGRRRPPRPAARGRLFTPGFDAGTKGEGEVAPRGLCGRKPPCFAGVRYPHGNGNGSLRPSPVPATYLPRVLPQPQRHPAAPAVGRSAGSSASVFVILRTGRRPPLREPGLWAALGRGTNRTWSAVGVGGASRFCPLNARKQSAVDPGDQPVDSRHGIFKSGGASPRANHAPRRPPQPVSARPAIFQTLFRPPIRIEQHIPLLTGSNGSRS